MSRCKETLTAHGSQGKRWTMLHGPPKRLAAVGRVNLAGIQWSGSVGVMRCENPQHNDWHYCKDANGNAPSCANVSHVFDPSARRRLHCRVLTVSNQQVERGLRGLRRRGIVVAAQVGHL